MHTKASAFIALLLGLGLLVGAGYLYSDSRRLLAVAYHAQGTVAGFERRTSKGGHSEYPIVEFTTASGELRRFTTSGAGDYAKGERVEVLFDPLDAGNVRVNSFAELWFSSLALGAFGVLCVGAGIATIRYERARNSAGPKRPPAGT